MTTATRKQPLRLAVLISGTGRTLKNLLVRIEAGTLDAEIRLVVANVAGASGLQYAKEASVPQVVIPHKEFPSTDDFSQAIFDACRAAEVELVMLAGFIRRLTIPEDFANRVINIHPALVPSFCGKGFYGHHVHEAVLNYGAKLTGCTVHFVDNEYDHGPVILQKAVPVRDDDTPDTLAARVFEAETEIYPDAVQLIAQGRVTVDGRRVRIAKE